MRKIDKPPADPAAEIDAEAAAVDGGEFRFGPVKAKRLTKVEARALALRNLAEMSDEENASLTAAAKADPDNLPAEELFKRRGRPKKPHPKQAIKLRLDEEVVAAYRASGDGWQTRMNEVLRNAAGLK